MTDPAAPPPQDAPRSRRGWFRNGCLTLVVLFGVLAIIGTLTGGNDRTPVERAEQDEGVEGGGKEPEAKKPLQGEKAVEPESGEREQSRSLYQQAVLEETPPYEIDFTASDTGQRYDVFVVTEPTRDKPRLGRILVDLGEKSGANLVTAYFCARPGEQACNDTFIAHGEFAATAQGKSYMTGEKVLSEVGEVPFMRIEF